MFARAVAVSAAGFLIGVFYASLAPRTLLFAVALLGSAAIFLIASRMTASLHPLCAVFFLCACMAGILRFDVARVAPEPLLEQAVGARVVLQGTIDAEPDVRERSTRLVIRVTRIEDSEPAEAVRVLAVAPAFTHVAYGDTVTVEGVIRKPEPFESGAGRTFNYPMFLAARGVGYQVDFAEVQVLNHGGNPVVRAALSIKAAYISGLRSVLPEPYAGLAAGITAGDKRSVGNELSETFQRVSLVHILVLSGYNITVVMSVLLYLSARLTRAPRLLVSVATIVFFILISGAAASSVRAGAMAFAAVSAQMFGRRFVALRVLAAIVVLMVLANPYVLAFDPGFQLSVLATLGLVLFAGDIAAWMKVVPERFGVRDIVASTIATQTAVLPLLLYQSGTLSLVALPANILALVAVPLAMAFSAIAALAGILFGTWGTILALPALVFLRYIVCIAEMFAGLPFAAVSVPAFSAWVLAPVYAGIGAIVLYRYRVQKEKS